MRRSVSTRRPTVSVFSIGYQGKKVAALCDQLVDAGVTVLVDVRAVAWSQRPEFRKTALANALKAKGIEYVHCKVAGNPYRAASKEPDGWVDCERLYRAHVRANKGVLDAVEEQVRRGAVALFCYEAERACCHRGVLLDELRGRVGKLAVTDL